MTRPLPREAPLASRAAGWIPALLVTTTYSVGCTMGPSNPSFPVTPREARDQLRAMRDEPVRLERPVLVLAGLHDPGFLVDGLARSIKKIATDDAQVIAVSFLGLDSFDECRDRAIETIRSRLPDASADRTAEIDVVGFSMGGIVARWAARFRDDGIPRLNIRRLFTVSTPHVGARLADLPTLDRRARDMRAKADFLQRLNESEDEAIYELIPYTRLGDLIVGEDNAAPPGRAVWWVPSAPLSLAHINAGRDPRILADIARRLRGQAPLTIEPPAALP